MKVWYYGGMKRLDLVGQQFGKLTVTEFSHIGGKTSYWKCVCECGAVHVAQGSHLKNGNIRSCGCLPVGVKPTVDDPVNRTRAYRAWRGMWTRCTDSRCHAHKRYLERGTKVCERWSSFLRFVEDMGYPPKGHTLDRIDNNGDYTPNNCRWATRKEQARNRGVTIFVTVQGKAITLAERAEQLGLTYNVAYKRWRRGRLEE